MVASLIVFGALLGGASAQEARPAFLTHEELRQLLSGTTTVQFVSGNAKGTGIYTQDRTARLDGGSWQAKGSWRIDGNKFCTKYPGIRRGYETCYSLQRTGENAYTLHDGESGMSSTWLVEK
jgi:hypothetical protein